MDEILDEGLFNTRNEQDKKDFKFYKSFHNIGEAREFVELLNAHNIPYSAERSGAILDEAIVGTGLIPKAVIKIKPEDFKKVNAIIEDQLAGVDYAEVSEHYLNQLDDTELKEIFQKPDEWSVEDVNIAKIILRGRGINISDEEIQTLRDNRLQEIRKGKEGNKVWMIIYFLGIVVGIFTNVIFTIAGMGMGYYYSYSKSVDPDGEKHFVFEPTTRKYGKFILYGGNTVLIIELLTLLQIL